MAFSYSPKVVTDGLVLYLDAANPNSYVSGSTTWRDISRSGINGTLVNGPTFSSDGGGSIVFDGVDDFISFPTYTFGNGNWTLNMWINSNDSGFYNLMTNSSSDPVANAFGYYTNKIYYQNYDNNPNWKMNFGNTTLSTNTWYMLTWVNYAGASPNLGTMRMFVNGVSDSNIFSSYTTNGGPCNVIGRFWGTRYFNGEVSTATIYQNKSLTSQEILQNFNATKTRFGL